MTPSSRSLAISAFVAIAGIAVVDVVYARYAQTHFGPNITLRQAEAADDGCLVTLGDSRMAAGIDAIALRDSLHASGLDICVASLGVGALPISGQAMALRRYIADGHKPSLVVLGASVGTLLDDPAPDPNVFFGNRAAELAWSVPSDVNVYYQGFPFTDLDRGVRFSLARSNALSIYASALWFKTQAVQDRLTGKSRDEPRNRFGSLADMHALLGGFRDEAMKGLSTWDGHWRLSPWFEIFRQLAHSTGARLIVLEVPMPLHYRQEVLDSAPARRYAAWLQGELARTNDAYSDLSAPSSLNEENFGDGVHLDATGARDFSLDLGNRIGSILTSP